MTRMKGTLKVVAVQPAPSDASPETMLQQADDLTRAAVREHAPDLVVLPAALTVGNRPTSRVPGAVRPVDGAPLQLLRRLSRELEVTVAGGFHARRGAHAYATYALVQPDGCTRLSNGSSLLPEEARYCAPGRADGFTRCGGLPVGVLNGLEWAEVESSRRLAGRVRLVLGGLAWPGAGGHRHTARMWTGGGDPSRLDAYVRSLPLWQTRLFGVPAVLAVPGGSRTAPGIGATQIVDADGSVLASVPARDGEGYIAADVTLPTERRPRQSLTGKWIGHGPGRVSYEAALRRESLAYRRDHLAGRHPWQHWPGGDLPDEQGPGPAHAVVQATTFDWKAV